MSAIVLWVICAWCQRTLREGTPGALISHGLCDRCRQQIEQDEAA